MAIDGTNTISFIDENPIPIAPKAPKKPNYDYNLINNQIKYELYQNSKDAYKKDKAKYQEDLQKYNAELEQAKLWDREDEIRQHTEEREDTAYSRAIADLRASGANINLMNPQPAQSGGGITSATEKDYTLMNTAFQGEIDRVLQAIELEFQEDENAKDRWAKLLSSFANIFAIGQIANSKPTTSTKTTTKQKK